MFPAAGTIACWLCLRWPDQYHLPKLVYPSRVLRFDFFVEPVFDLSKPVRNRLFELVEAKPCMWTGRHRSSEAVCLFERLICRRDCSDCEVGHTADFATCDHCPVVNTESRACLDHLTKWSMIVASSTAERDHWSRSVAPPSVAQYAKLPEWATVLAVWHQCGRTVGRPVGGRRSWLRFGVIIADTCCCNWLATPHLPPLPTWC